MKDMGKIMGSLKSKYADSLDLSKSEHYFERTLNSKMKYPKNI